MPVTRERLFVVLMLLLSLSLAGCTPDKAKAVAVGANQFKIEAHKAIDALDKMHVAELSTPPDLVAGSGATFPQRFYAFQGAVTFDVLQKEVHQYPPYKSSDEWKKYVADLKQTYADFAGMYANLERGYLFAREEVAASVKIAEKLTVQLVVIADSVSKNPAILHQYRTSVLAEAKRLRALDSSNPERNAAASRLREQIVTVETQEQELTRAVVEQSLIAAKLGIELRKLLAQYDQMSLDDLHFFINRALQIAGSVSGKDLGGLSKDVDEAVATIKADPVWNSVLETQLKNASAFAARK